LGKKRVPLRGARGAKGKGYKGIGAVLKEVYAEGGEGDRAK